MSTLAQVSPPNCTTDTARPVPFWLWPNLLCLDAPIVALVWQDFLARCFSVPLLPQGRLTLMLTVWAIYLGDRLLDVRTLAQGAETGPHRFCREHRRAVTALLIAVLIANLTVCLVWVRRPVLWNGMAVFAGVAVYFEAFPVRRLSGIWKPLAAAGLFTLGVFLIAWTRLGEAGRMLAWPAIAFGVLCLANLLLIQAWERREWHRARALGGVMAVLAAVCLLAQMSLWYLAVALAAAGLATLAFLGNRLGRDARRVMADAVLLSPLLLWTLPQ